MLLAKCINNIDPWNNNKTDLVIDKYYYVEDLNIGQSYSTVKIEGVAYNSVMFKYYDDFLKSIDIYKKYNPYETDTNCDNYEKEKTYAEFEVRRHMSKDETGIILYIFSDKKKLKTFKSVHRSFKKDVTFLLVDDILKYGLDGYKIKEFHFL